MAEPPQKGPIDIPEILQSLGNRGWTGTLEIIAGEQEKRVFMFFKGGVIQHVRADAERAVLGLMLYKLRKLDQADLNFALTAQSKSQKKFGDTCLEYGLVSERDIYDALVFRGRDEILSLFLEKGTSDTNFHPGEEPKEGAFEDEDLRVQLGLTPISILMEAARREDEWSVICQYIDTLDEVYTKVDDGRPIPVELRPIVLMCDGTRTVEEIGRFSPWPQFEAYNIVKDLYKDGFLKTINAEQLAHAAVAAEMCNNADKALRLFELAESRGLNRVAVSRRIAIAHQKLGHTKQAFKRWMVYAEKCLQHNNPQAAVEGLRCAISVSPTNFEAYDKLAEIYTSNGHGELIASYYKQLIDALTKDENQLDLILAYQKYLITCPQDKEILLLLANGHAELGEKSEAIERYEELAKLHREQNEREKAVAVLEKVTTLDASNLSGRLSLAQIYEELQQAKEAANEYQQLVKILTQGDEESVNWSFLTKVHESIVRINPSLSESWQCLAERYKTEGKTDLAVSRFMGWAQSLRGQAGREKEMIVPLEAVAELAPERVDVRQQLARIYLHVQEKDRALKTLFALADYALSQKNQQLARETFNNILKSEPLNLEARMGQARLDEMNGKYEIAARRWRIVGGMLVRAGLFERAEPALRRALDLDKNHPETLKDYADAKEGLMHQDEAAELLVRYTALMIENRNFGLADSSLSRIRELSPQHPQLASLQQRLSGST